MENQARFSSSAVDASYFIMQIGTFWKNLEWPVAAEAYGYLCTIIEVFSSRFIVYYCMNASTKLTLFYFRAYQNLLCTT